VGDSIWDLLAARRAGALGVGLLAGGYGREELERAGAYRVYADPADLLAHLDEVGIRSGEDWAAGEGPVAPRLPCPAMPLLIEGHPVRVTPPGHRRPSVAESACDRSVPHLDSAERTMTRIPIAFPV